MGLLKVDSSILAIDGSLVTAVYPYVPGDTLGFWAFEDNLLDSGPAGNDFTQHLNAPTYVTGKVGKAVTFGAFAGAYTTSAAISDCFAGNSSFTTNLWFRPGGATDDIWGTNIQGGPDWLLESQYPSPTGLYPIYFNINTRIRSDGSYVSIRTGNLLRDAWHNHTLTFDKDTSIATVYINGVEFDSITLGAVVGGRINIGYITKTSSAILDQFRMYNRVLTIAEINSLYNAGNGR